jgi:hypothetical protein
VVRSPEVKPALAEGSFNLGALRLKFWIFICF